MRKSIRALLGVALVGVLAIPALQAQAPAPAGGRKPRVAILDFEYATIRDNARAYFGSESMWGRASQTCS